MGVIHRAAVDAAVSQGAADPDSAAVQVLEDYEGRYLAVTGSTSGNRRFGLRAATWTHDFSRDPQRHAILSE